MSDSIAHIPLSALRESPFNPRKQFDEKSLRELADSINTQGILQPIVVRPLADLQADVEHRYEIVFGHRRARAAALSAWYDEDSGVLGVPCIVREMTDSEAAIAQVHENGQRKNVTALEEADSLAHLHRAHGIKADDIVTRVGMSRSYVYARLKLAAASDDVRTAIDDEQLPPETALEIARLRGDKLQRAGLKACRDHNGDWLSQRQAKARVHNLFDCRLEDAEFDPAQADLLKFAGACTRCPKLAGNDPDLLDAGLAADVCTDSSCFTEKQRAHTRVVLLPRFKAQGLDVIDGEQAVKLWPNVHRGPDDYRQANDDSQIINIYTGRKPGEPGYMGEENGYLSRMLAQVQADLAEWGQPVPNVPRVAIVSPHTHLAQLFAPRDVVADLVAAWNSARQARAAAMRGDTPTPSTAARSEDTGRDDDRLADWTPAERLTHDHAAWGRVRLATLRALFTRPRTTDELRMLLLRELECVGELRTETTDLMGLDDEYDAADESIDDLDTTAWWQEKLASLTADQIGILAAGLAIESALTYTRAPRDKAAAMVAIAERYGVDVVAAAQPEQMDNAGDAGGSDAQAGARNADLFGATA